MVTCLMICLCENVGSTNDHELRKPSNFYLFQLCEQNTNCKPFVSVVKHSYILKITKWKRNNANKSHWAMRNKTYEITKRLVL